MPSMTLDDSRFNTFFITLKVINGLPVLLSEKYFKIIVSSIDYCQTKKGLRLLAYAILNNHVHLVFWLEEKIVLKDLVRDFKHFTASQLIKQLKFDENFVFLKYLRQAAQDRQDRNLCFWRRNVHPEMIYSDSFLEQKIHYVNFNAVHHGVVSDPQDYLYTSYHNYFETGVKPILNVCHF